MKRDDLRPWRALVPARLSGELPARETLAAPATPASPPSPLAILTQAPGFRSDQHKRYKAAHCVLCEISGLAVPSGRPSLTLQRVRRRLPPPPPPQASQDSQDRLYRPCSQDKLYTLHRLYQQCREFILCPQSVQLTTYTQDAVCRLMLFVIIPAESRE
eukprot:gene12506-biopygen8509